MKTRAVDRSDAPNYLHRADECLHAAQRSFETGEWDACVIMAVHCAIAAADAVCVAKLGLRNASDRHNDAVQLFASIGSSEEIVKNVQHLSNLLDIKTSAEYGNRLQLRPNAEAALKHAERFLSFSRDKIK
jgi:HEPN domain-containing protein